MRINVIGAGLMGSSIALALSDKGHEISISDSSKTVQSAARVFLNLSAETFSDPDVVLVAVPPASISQVIIESKSKFSNATLIDIASIMSKPINEVEATFGAIDNWIPSHPMAGKESGGFENASYDLLKDRLWVISPLPNTPKAHIERAQQVIKDCGALVFEMPADEHDRTVALTSHLPQILATALAEQLNGLKEEALLVSGQGLRDLTRIAASSGNLWNEILVANKENVVLAIDAIQATLESFKNSIAASSNERIIQHFDSGNEGKKKIPGKHGGAPQNFTLVAIEIDDKPGQLAAIFATAGNANVNIEDVRIDHALGKEVAIVELYVEKENAVKLKSALSKDGWKLRSISDTE